MSGGDLPLGAYMASPLRRESSRYRRRILAIGGGLFGLLFVVGAPVFLDRVETDLEGRVPQELSAAGFGGVIAEFDGQDGTLSCSEPLSDPEDAVAIAYEVRGVRVIELDRSCRVAVAPSTTVASDTTVGESSGENEPSSDSGEESSADDTDASSSGADGTVPDDSGDGTGFGSVAAAVSENPQLSVLALLLQESGLGAELGDAGAPPVTLFGPNNDAFEALPADVLADLRSDPDRLREVLDHHLAPGNVSAEQLAGLAGDTITMADGTALTVEAVDDSVAVGGATILVPDLLTPNGTVHVVGQVIVPDDVDLSEPLPAASVNASYDTGAFELTGVVASEAVRATLLTAAAAAPGGARDLMTVDPATGVDTATAAALAPMLAAMPQHLLSGTAGFDGTDLYLSGVYLTEADGEAMAQVAEAVAVTADLVAPPDATPDDAVSLEDQLNAYVLANPVLFDPGRASLTESSLPVLDQIALLAQQFDGIAITVEGHTDSDGNANDNLLLSRVRAFTVMEALIERGLPESALSFEGFGSEQPILVDGVEDKAASRRVEFRVETTT